MPQCPPRGACAIAALAAVAAVRDLIEERCGLRFDDSQCVSLSSSVAARMQQLGLACEDEYFERLRGGTSRLIEAELRNLLNLVTITETCFFRDASQFRVLRDLIIPTFISERRAMPRAERTIRIWSAGCSSGEEAYSIALTLEDMGAYAAHPDWTFDIVATDLNTNVLEKARQGIYTPRAVRHVDVRLLSKYFSNDGGTFALRDEIKRKVTFEFGNLMQTAMPPAGPQDVVFCKNVAIYFRPEGTRRLIAGLRDTIVPGGYLLLGHAESLWQMSDGFTMVEHDRTFCYRKASDRPAAPEIRPDRTRKTRHAVESDRSEDAAVQYDGCLDAFRAGDWDAAESRLSALVASCPTFVPALLLLGGLYAHRGRLDEAIAQAAKVLQLSDLEARAHLLVGMIASRRRRFDEAVQSLRRALYLDDSLALGHFWLGNLYRDRGDIARACREYENVVCDWEQHTLQFTEEFAQDLTAEQIVEYCRQYVPDPHG